IDSAMRLRYKVFKQRLGWEVTTQGDQERDQFDSLPDTLYILHIGTHGEVDGCIRLLPTMGPNMLRDVFPILLEDKKAPCSPNIWECSRFAVAQDNLSQPGLITARLLDAMYELGTLYGFNSIVAVTDLLVEKLLRKYGTSAKRIGNIHQIGVTKAVAAYYQTNLKTLAQLRTYSGFSSSQIYVAPWIREAA
ncbi:MAG: acyl-homoserine-lactone synthase, partial [Gammaproteobacteria bacterium]|nr:acyl-homoserine-lactone synthase [Gammaproteobacteria bacterium]